MLASRQKEERKKIADESGRIKGNYGKARNATTVDIAERFCDP